MKNRSLSGTTVVFLGICLLLLIWLGTDGSPPGKSLPAVLPDTKAVSKPSPATQSVISAVRVSPDSNAPAGTILSTRWNSLDETNLIAFTRWTSEYLTTRPIYRPALLPSGIEFARNRLAVLAALIRSDPQTALEAAVPIAIRKQLPPEITSLLEERVSGPGKISLLCANPPTGAHESGREFRSALVNGREFLAYTYGRRGTFATLPDVSIHGIAIGEDLAVSDSPLRVLEPGETAGDKPIEHNCAVCGKYLPTQAGEPLNLTNTVAAEANGKVHLFCAPEHLAEYESNLEQAESPNQDPILAANGQPGSSGVGGRPSFAWSHGTKRVLIIRVDFPDLSGPAVNNYDGQTVTETYVSDRFNGPSGVRDYYEQGSYGQASLQLLPAVNGDSPDVTGVLRMPRTAAYYATNYLNSLLHMEARDAAQAAGFAIGSYQRIGVVFPYLGSLVDSRITYGGLGEIIGTNFWINGYFTFSGVAHELGHTFGLNHANLWKVTDGNPLSSSGSSEEYADPFDVMGHGVDFEDQFTHWNKSIMRWIPDASVMTITNSGTYRVYRYDAPNITLTNPLVLKIVRDATKDFWIAYRRAVNNPSLNNGAYIIWGANNNQQGNLLDLTTPGNSGSDAALALGATLNDSNAGISVTPMASGGTAPNQWIDVRVTLQSHIQWSAPAFYVDEQIGQASLTVTRSYGSSGAVSLNYATSNGTAVAPGDYTSSSGSLTWADGELGSKTIAVPIAPDFVQEAGEFFTVTLTPVSGSAVYDNPIASVIIESSGASDPQFTPDYVVSMRTPAVKRVLTQPDGGIVFAGSFYQVYSHSIPYAFGGIARFKADGSLDIDFPAGAGVTGGASPVVQDIAWQPDGKYLIAGAFDHVNGIARTNIARLNSDGSLDASFNAGIGPNDIIYSLLLQPDGRLIVAGKFTSFAGYAREYLARLNADGAVDTSFVGPDFQQTTGYWAESLALQSDGKLLVGGVFYLSPSPPYKLSLCRVNTNGSLDSSFNGVAQGAYFYNNGYYSGIIHKILVMPDAKILIAGTFTEYNNTARNGVARLTSTGTLDSGFAPSLNSDVTALYLQPDGKVLVGGGFTTPAVRLARFTSNGSFDSFFSAPGGLNATPGLATPYVNDFAFQADGRAVFGSDFGGFQGTTNEIFRFFAGLPALPGTVQWSSNVYSGREGFSVSLTATRVGGSLGAITVGYSTVPGSASASDFTTTQGSLTWADGDASPKSVSVPITPDALDEPVESFTINLGQPLIGGAILGAFQQAKVYILPSPPMLKYTMSGGSLILSWSTNSPGFTLESAAGLTPPVWNEASPAPVVIGSNYVVTTSANLGSKLYRLRAP